MFLALSCGEMRELRDVTEGAVAFGAGLAAHFIIVYPCADLVGTGMHL